MTYIPATGTRDLWAVLGGLLAIAIGVVAWVRRADRDPSDLNDAVGDESSVVDASAPDADAGEAPPPAGSESGQAA